MAQALHLDCGSPTTAFEAVAHSLETLVLCVQSYVADAGFFSYEVHDMGIKGHASFANLVRL